MTTYSSQIHAHLATKDNGYQFTAPQLARELDATSGAVSGYLHSLADKGVIKRVGKLPSQPGVKHSRPRILFELVDASAVTAREYGNRLGKPAGAKSMSKTARQFLPALASTDQFADQLNKLAGMALDIAAMAESVAIQLQGQKVLDRCTIDELLTELRRRTKA